MQPLSFSRSAIAAHKIIHKLGENLSLEVWRLLTYGITLLFILYDLSWFAEYREPIVNALRDYWLPLGAVMLLLVARFLSPQRPNRWISIVLVAGLLTIQVHYLYWRVTETLIFNGVEAVFSLGFFAFEFLMIFNSSLSNVLLLLMRDRSKAAERHSQLMRRGTYKPTVDILIPTYNEPANVLRRTLIACKSIKYPRDKKNIWLLDDGDRPEIKALAELLKCNYIARPDHNNAKAGNLNYALKQVSSDIVVVFDADFVPLNNFLERTLGFFHADSNLAMVVTPQNFYNPDPPQKNLGGKFIPGDMVNFYQVIQPSRDVVNAVICSGTSIVYRRAHLDTIGGIPTTSIVEDYLTGMSLQAQGYRTIYLNEFLSVGSAANNINEYAKQRSRWCEGTLQTVLTRYNPLIMPGLNPIQRMVYLSGILFWVKEILNCLSFAAPLLYLFFGIRSFQADFSDAFFWGLSAYCISMITVSWLQGSLLTQVVYNLLQGPHALWAALRVFVLPNLENRFEVTSKKLEDYKVHFNLRTNSFAAMLFALTLGGIGYQLALGMANSDGAVNGLYFFWAQINLVFLAVALIAGVGTARDRGYPRVPCYARCRVVMPNGRTAEAQLRDISEAGAAFVLKERLTLEPQQTFRFEIPQAAIRVEAEVRHVGGVVACQFSEENLVATRKLVNFTYCNPVNWIMPRLPNEGDAFRAMAAGVWGLHPFSLRRK